MINYEEEVKRTHPDAKCVGAGIDGLGILYYMIIGVGLGENYHDTKKLAWKNAYNKIKEAYEIPKNTK